MSDFQLNEIEVVDGYPHIKLFKLDGTEAVIQHFITRLYRELPEEEWDAADEMLQEYSTRAQLLEHVRPGGNWTINLSGDKVRAPELKNEAT